MSEYPKNSTEIKFMLERIAKLESMVNMQRTYSFPQQVRLAKTIENPDISEPKYPVSGNVFPIVFIDGDFPASPGEQTVTYNELDAATPSKVSAYACNITGEYVEEGTVIRVSKHMGENDGDNDGVWWFDVSKALPTCEYRVSYGKEESYTESGVSRYRWHESYDSSHSGEYCGIFDDHGYGTNTLQSSTIGAGSWFWTYVYGSPEDVGIVQDETVTGSDIFDTGTLDVTKSGFYEFELDISWNLGGVGGNTGTNQRIPLVATTSGGSPSHTHSDSTPDTTGVNSIFGGVYMFRQGDTAINATYQYYSDEFTKPRRVFHNINCAETHVFAEGSIKNHVWKFRANLNEGDRIAFRPYAIYLAVYQKRKSQLQVQCQSMIITRLKDSETGTDLTA